MKIEYYNISGTDFLRVTSTEITNLMANKVDYSSVRLDVTLNCGEVLSKELTIAEMEAGNDYFVFSEGFQAIAVWPNMFGLGAGPPDTYIDGVYSITVKIYPIAGGFTQEANCTFVDVDYKCRLALLLEDVIKNQDPGTTAHLLHYALVNGSNCGCNCEELCEIFAALTELLGTYNIPITNDCGC